VKCVPPFLNGFFIGGCYSLSYLLFICIPSKSCIHAKPFVPDGVPYLKRVRMHIHFSGMLTTSNVFLVQLMFLYSQVGARPTTVHGGFKNVTTLPACCSLHLCGRAGGRGGGGTVVQCVKNGVESTCVDFA
jgi:hypothetical protein